MNQLCSGVANLDGAPAARAVFRDPRGGAAGGVAGIRAELSVMQARPGEEVSAPAALLGPWHTLNITARADLSHVVIDVYDIQVDGDQSFVAEGVLVHNCLICGSLDGPFYAMGESLPQSAGQAQSGCYRRPAVSSLAPIGMDSHADCA